jgi:hypothetical protein
VRPARTPKTKNHDPLAVEETYTLEESRENFGEHMNLTPSIIESVPNVPSLNTAPINYGNYNAMIAGTEFSACGGLWGFNGPTHEDQPWYGQPP